MFQLWIVLLSVVICCEGLATITLKLVVDVLPAASRAVHVTAVVPIANSVPEAGAQETVGVLTVSVAVGAV